MVLHILFAAGARPREHTPIGDIRIRVLPESLFRNKPAPACFILAIGRPRRPIVCGGMARRHVTPPGRGAHGRPGNSWLAENKPQLRWTIATCGEVAGSDDVRYEAAKTFTGKELDQARQEYGSTWPGKQEVNSSTEQSQQQ